MLGTTDGESAVERHSSSTAAENHRGQGEAPFVPSLKAAGKRSNALKSTAA